MEHKKHLNMFISTLKPQEVVIVAGVPGSGKTSLEMSIAVQCAMIEKKKVAIFSLEIPSEYIIQRLLCLYAGVSIKKMISGKSDTDDLEKIKSASAVLKESKIFIDDESRATPISILKKCQEFELTTGKIDLIMIDYLELMEYSDGNAHSGEEKILLIIDDLKKIATELNVAILVVMQCSQRIGERVSYERKLPKEIQPLWLLLGKSDFSDKRLEAGRGENVGMVIPLSFDYKSLQFWEA